MTTTLEETRTIMRRRGAVLEITPDLACLQQPIVNLCFFGEEGALDSSWVLIDAGLPYFTAHILRAAAERYGSQSRPAAIILSHAHFDHVGALSQLVRRWQVPVYAHPLGLPYLTGRSKYPPGDPSVGGGAMAWMARFYPRGPIDIGDAAQELPRDGSVPAMPGWRWIHTPGHSPGHVSLFRESDRVLIAGDAFVTTKQESLIAALTKPIAVHPPPAYYTIDWQLARRSIETLAELEPEIAVTGHGIPMMGKRLRAQLHTLARDFDESAIPRYGRYIHEPAIADENGVAYIPPPVINPRQATAAIGAAVVLAALMGYYYSRKVARQREAHASLG